MKKVFIAALFLCSLDFAFADDAALFGELNSAYKSGAFPSAIEYSVELENEYPRSVLLGRSLAIRGECLFRLGRNQEAVEVLQNAIPLVKSDGEVLLSCYYYKGKSYSFYDQTAALNAFYDAMSLRGEKPSKKENRLYYLSAVNAASIFYNQGEYEKALPLLEAAVANGTYFNSSEHDSNLLLLFDTYLKTKNSKRLLDVYAKVTKDSVSSVTYANIKLDAGAAYEELGQWKQAYNEYVYVLENCDALYASLALQKAYNVASLHKAQVGQEPGLILERAKDNLREYDFLLAEFWTRLAIDAFNENDYKKAEGYFANAKASDKENDYALLHGIYISRMQKTSRLSVLKTYGDSCGQKEQKPFYLEWLCECASASAAEGLFDECRSYCETAVSLFKNDSSKKELYNKTLYYYALSLLQAGENNTAWELYKNVKPSSKDEEILRARLLCTQKSWNEAASLYEKNSKELTASERVDYSKVLFYLGAVNSSYRQASTVNTNDALYMTALSSFNKKDWKTAELYFGKYISSQSVQKADYALFYQGYAQYKMGQSLSAFTTLSRFVKKYPTHPLVWNASMTAASSAVQNSNLNAAGEYAQNAVKVSATEQQKQQSLLLAAEILSDGGKYDEAVALLASSAKEKSDFGILARYQTALIYSKQNKLTESDRMFEEIQNKFTSNALADESSYRRGELYYTAGQYPQAVSRFNEYHKKFPNGRFKDAAYYYMADSYTSMEQYERAKIQYETLLEAYPESPYVYNTRKNLTVVYKTTGDYQKALALAKETVSLFPKETKSDSFNEEISSLTTLAGGANPQYVKLSEEYKAAGSSSSKEGRIAGTALCEFMVKDAGLKNDGVILAGELYSIQSKKSDEAPYACRTGIIYAQDLREQNLYEKAAGIYMSCAVFASQADKSLQQRALYSAAECFLAADKYGDALQVSEKLHELYPGSDYDVKCKSLFE